MTNKKQGVLGRGLGALISSGASSAVEEVSLLPPQVQEPKSVTLNPPVSDYHALLVAQIHASAYQPRHDFDTEAMESLKESIRAQGLLQPICVRPKADGYEVVAGERRLRACRALGWERIAARIVDADDPTAATLALLENLQREDLNAIEEALGYASLMRDFGLTQEKIAQHLGRKRSSIANSLRLLQLDAEIQGYLSRGLLSMGHAKVLLGLTRSIDQLWAARRSVERALSVRQTETLVRDLTQQALVQGKSGDPQLILPPTQRQALQRLESLLSNSLQTPVAIRQGRTQGSIVLKYRDAKELQAIMARLGVES